MDKDTQARFDARAKIMKAMAHPTRLFILEQLSRQEQCVCDLTGMIGADISTVSKHLTVLKNAGLVDTEKRGVQVYYRMKAPCVMNFFGCLEDVMLNNARHQLRMLK